jgi:hypothetical protein
VLSGGRLTLGVGLGGSREDYRRLRGELGAVNRGQMMDEFVQALRALWTDVQRSPLIAAYFAVSRYLTTDTTRADAVIWVLRPHYLNSLELNSDLTFPIDADTAREMLEPAFRRHPENGKVLAVMAVEHDMRMFVQQGAFTIHSEPSALNKREGHSRYLTPLLVKADRVGRMAAELHCSGFRRGDIYPDLTNLADELKGLP